MKASPGKVARSARKGPEEAPAASEEAADDDTHDGERVLLDPLLREFLVLELPMVPLREDLRSEATPAIEARPVPAGNGQEARAEVDPRLAPLAAIARRLREKKE